MSEIVYADETAIKKLIELVNRDGVQTTKKLIRSLDAVSSTKQIKAIGGTHV
jgi:hypothetical protein